MNGLRGVPILLGCIVCAPLFAASDEKPVFDRGEQDDLKRGVVYKERKEDKKSKAKLDSRKVKAVTYHVKNLKDADPEVRQSSAEMLGILNAASAVPDLIDVLRPGREDKVMVMLSAHGALVRITGKNFGYKNYEEWQSWWLKEKDGFLRKAESAVDESSQAQAVQANSLGLELLNHGQYSAAQQQFLDALNHDPTVPDYKNNLGLAVMRQGRYLEAMEYFKEVFGMDPDLPQPYMNMGRCYSDMGKSIEAESWYKKALERDKNGVLWDASWLIGREHMKRADWQIAYDYTDQARLRMEKKNIHDPRVYKDLAIIHFGLDQYHSAWKEIKNVQTLGYDCDPGFVAKVRKELLKQGVDPDKEDKDAREVLKAANRPESDDATK